MNDVRAALVILTWSLALAPLGACGADEAPGDPTDGVLVVDVSDLDTASPPDTAATPDGIAGTDADADAVEPDADGQTPDDASDTDADADTGADGDAEDAQDDADAAPVDTWTGPPPPVTVSRPHWRLVFEDDFKGKTGAPDDDYCFDELPAQCHVWPSGNTHHCDLSDVSGPGFFPPTRANLVAAIRRLEPNLDMGGWSEEQVKARYGELIRARTQHLNKCTWTFYNMLNWMATDYQGGYSARFDPTLVEVDPSGKGYLKLTAALAPVETTCAFGGTGGDPNCQVHAFPPGVLQQGVAYWVDPDPRWPGVYYPPVSGACPHGGTFTGVNCHLHAFPPNFLEEQGVAYWVDADPQWPGVYYANRTYRCTHNIDYEPHLGFRNLTCPVLNGGVMSYAFTNRGWQAPDGEVHGRGRMQRQGRFEAKVRVPKGVGAFPAVWLMPEAGGWPYDGGEIDVVEARDAANEVYQTYHFGRCFDPATGQPMVATDSADCASKGGTSTHLAKGFTTVERTPDEFWTRDHLFAVEWTEDRFEYFINNVSTGVIEVGSVGRIDPGAPASLAIFESAGFPTRAFYWILNHSTWVPPQHLATFGPQTFLIDFVRSYEACGDDHAEYCPEGGLFDEAVGCVHGALVYPSPCQPARHECVNGGVAEGPRCRVFDFEPGQLVAGVSYWVDADPRWPGVYYAMIGGGCPHGGSGTVNCQLVALPEDLLETGVGYVVDQGTSPPGVFYTPDFRD